MNSRQLLLRNLLYYWRTNLAVVLGVITATAVIGGALIVGDSVRDSLREMSLKRLGDIDYAVTGQRFFREDLADELASLSDHVSTVAPAMIMQGTVEHQPEESERTVRAGRIQVYGVESRFWKFLDDGKTPLPVEDEIVVNRRVADQLQLSVDDTVSLIVEIPASIPRDSLLGDREETVTELVLTVIAIAEDEISLGRFGLNPSQQLPLNVFVSLNDLQTQTGLNAVARSKTNPVAKPARINALFMQASEDSSKATSAHFEQSEIQKTATALTDEIASILTLEDLALHVVANEDHGYVSLESEQMIIESSVADSAMEFANKLDTVTSPVLVYLLNEMRNPNEPESHSMYSVIAGFDPQQGEPFGPFQFNGEAKPLSKDAIYINDWLAADLKVSVSDRVNVKYHVVGDRGELPEEEHSFRVAGIVKLQEAANDTGFTPNVPGVTDAETYNDWREPFPLKRDEITERDDDYWEEYRTTPKMFLSLAAAQELWSSKYGNLTSLRIAPHSENGTTLEQLQQRFEVEFPAGLKPTQTGLFVQPIQLQGLQAAQGTTDFTGLFIGFSFFLILSAVILIGLLFRLGIEQRMSEFGLLSAVGLSPKQVRRLFLFEGTALVVLGAGLGVFAAIGYAGVMVYGLKTWWIGAIGTRFLFVSVTPFAVGTGVVIAVVVALGAIWWALFQTRHHSTRALLVGDRNENEAAQSQSGALARTIAMVAIPVTVLMLILTLAGVIPDTEAFSGFSWKIVMFFLVGMGMLVGSLSLLSAMLTSSRAIPIAGTSSQADMRLGLRNASRNRSRSVLTSSLIASAAFVIVAVAAGQQNPTSQLPKHDSPNGGFTLVAETSLPVLNDLNTAAGRSTLGFNPSDETENSILNGMLAMPFRVRPGENASCLNLYQTQLPTILGVPDQVLEEFIKNDRFSFANTPGDQPWSKLTTPLDSGNIPVLGDMNTLMYSMHKAIGDVVPVDEEDEATTQLEVVGMFNNSIFQGVLVMSEQNFEQLFPEQVGFQYFLIEVDPDSANEVSEVLEANLGDFGFDAEPVADRLANFLSVQNTYLATFQTLGGLGLLLGTIGLSTVMLRNVFDRRSEMALLRAVGFQKGSLGRMVAWENAFLLLWGLASGTLSALMAMSPHLLSTASELPWASLSTLLVGVFLLGMLTVFFAVRQAVKTPILSTLRGE